MSHFNQIDEAQRTESLRPIGVIALGPEALAERYGLAFEADEHDGSTAALVQTDRGQQYMLLHHFESPDPGTEVLASERSTEPERDLEDLLQALGIDAGLVTWKLSHDQAIASQQEIQPSARRVRRGRRRT
jgi:hypothetical protein